MGPLSLLNPALNTHAHTYLLFFGQQILLCGFQLLQKVWVRGHIREAVFGLIQLGLKSRDLELISIQLLLQSFFILKVTTNIDHLGLEQCRQLQKNRKITQSPKISPDNGNVYKMHSNVNGEKCLLTNFFPKAKLG